MTETVLQQGRLTRFPSRKQTACTGLRIARSDHLQPVHDTVRHTEFYARYARYTRPQRESRQGMSYLCF